MEPCVSGYDGDIHVFGPQRRHQLRGGSSGNLYAHTGKSPAVISQATRRLVLAGRKLSVASDQKDREVWILALYL